MNVNDLFTQHGSIFRLLGASGDKALIINCLEKKMPYWVNMETIQGSELTTQEELLERLNVDLPPYDTETTRIYLNNKWEEIVNRRILDIPGSCTEGQVSHVLSERFSRNPMGWSKEGLGKLSKLRVYVKNGGKITGEHFRKSRPKEIGYIEKMVKDNVSGCFDWSIFDGEPMIFDKSSGTQMLIGMLGQQTNRIFH